MQRNGRSGAILDPGQHAAVSAQPPSAVAPVLQEAPQDKGRRRGLGPSVPGPAHRGRVAFVTTDLPTLFAITTSYHLTAFPRVRLAMFVDDLGFDFCGDQTRGTIGDGRVHH